MHEIFKGAYCNTGKEKCMGYSRAPCFLVFTSEIEILIKKYACMTILCAGLDVTSLLIY